MTISNSLVSPWIEFQSRPCAPAEKLFSNSPYNRPGRVLQQATGVKIDYVIGLSDQSRAQAAKNKMDTLSSGSSILMAAFSRQLDQELAKRGKAPIQLDASNMQFSQATVSLTQQRSGGGAAETSSYQAAALFDTDEDDKKVAPAATEAASSGTDQGILIVVICALVFGFLAVSFIFVQRGACEQNT